MTTFRLGEDKMTAGIAVQILKKKITPILSSACKERIRSNRADTVAIAQGEETVYGINTGFGPLCTTKISRDKRDQLQINLLKSHSVGMGPLLDKDLSRLMLILKVHALCQGYSGIALETVERILWHIQDDVIPAIPSQGSVGASGDLAPLAHLFLPLIGLGEVWQNDKTIPASEALNAAGISPLELRAKEGLALINGTQFILAHGVQLLDRMATCLDYADLIGAMMVEGLLGSIRPFDADLHAIRPHDGVQHVAWRMTAFLTDSDIVKSHEDCDRVQDPYSLRCIPQVHGASRTAWAHLKDVIDTELNSVTDNPIIFDQNRTISGGNFHGQPLALPIDYCAMAACELGNISDRRIYLALHGVADRVPSLLIENAGLNSGFMITQYTTAALVSENKSMAFPASVDSIPTSLGQEDHVSMGSISGVKALKIIENVEKILAIELFNACQLFDFHASLQPGPVTQAVQSYIRQYVDFVREDRLFKTDMDRILNMIRNKALDSVIHDAAKQAGMSMVSPWQKRFELT